MARLVAPVMMFVAACGTSSDQAAELCDFDPEGYRQAAAALDAAISAKDGRTLERLIADDFLWVRGTGAKGDKQGFIGALTADSLTIEPFEAEDPKWILTVNGALLTATNSLRGSSNGEPFLDRHRYGDYWVWRDCKWQLVYAQVTPIQAAKQ